MTGRRYRDVRSVREAPDIVAAMIETLRADLARYCSPGARHQDARWSRRAVAGALLRELGVWAVIEYRLRRWCKERRGPARLPLAILAAVTQRLIEMTTGISIAGGARFGPGLYIGHFGGITVGPGVVVGENCNLSQGVTLGDHGGSPVIGDCVYVAPGAKVFGAIVVGDNVAIGANAVVNRDVPAGSTAVGVPARIIEGRGNLLDARA